MLKALNNRILIYFLALTALVAASCTDRSDSVKTLCDDITAYGDNVSKAADMNEMNELARKWSEPFAALENDETELTEDDREALAEALVGAVTKVTIQVATLEGRDPDREGVADESRKRCKTMINSCRTVGDLAARLTDDNNEKERRP